MVMYSLSNMQNHKVWKFFRGHDFDKKRSWHKGISQGKKFNVVLIDVEPNKLARQNMLHLIVYLRSKVPKGEFIY